RAERRRSRFAPTPRLVLTTALVLLPPALLELADARWSAILVLLAGLLALAAIVDLVLALPRARGVVATVRPLTRVSLGRTGEVEARLTVENEGPRRIRVGLATPAELVVEAAEADVDFPAGPEAAAVRIAWRVKPSRRGNYKLEQLHAQLVSSLGWWHVRWVLPVSGEVRVYPNLLRESRRLAALFLRRPAPGWRNQRQIGRGREFEQLREYLPGDG